MSSAAPHRPLPMFQILLCGALIVTLSMGVRHGFGLWLQPMISDNNWTREHFSLAMAIQNLTWGFTGIFAGMLADRFGAFKVLVVCALFYALGLVGMAYSPTPTLLALTCGVLIGLAQAGTTYAVIYGVIGRNIDPEKRSWAMGIAAAAGSFGQFLMLPLEGWMISTLGWQQALVWSGSGRDSFRGRFRLNHLAARWVVARLRTHRRGAFRHGSQLGAGGEQAVDLGIDIGKVAGQKVARVGTRRLSRGLHADDLARLGESEPRRLGVANEAEPLDGVVPVVAVPVRVAVGLLHEPDLLVVPQSLCSKARLLGKFSDAHGPIVRQRSSGMEGLLRVFCQRPNLGRCAPHLARSACLAAFPGTRRSTTSASSTRALPLPCPTTLRTS